MATVARVKKEGALLLKDTINERLPVITDGLVAYYPLDSKAGAIDVIKGSGTNQNVESGLNILDVLTTSWKDPNNWDAPSVLFWDEAEQALKCTAYTGEYATNFIKVDTSKSYYLEADVKIASGSTGILYYGFRFYDASYSEIGIGTHHGTYDYTGCSGYTPTTSWTHVNNSGIGGAPKTGEAESGSTVFHTGTKYVKLLFLFNYGGAGTTWVKNLRLTTSNADTSNVVVDNGIAVQEATTNLVTDITPAWGPWAGFTGSSQSYLAPDGTQGVVLNAITGGGCMWRYTNGNGNYITVSENTVYTVSAKVKTTNLGAVSANFFYIRTYDNATSQIWEWGYFSSSNTRLLENGYYLCWGTFTAPAGCVKLLIQAYEYAGGQQISCYDLQLEQRSFTTAYVNGSKSESTIHIPVVSVLNNTTGTINFNYFKKYGLSNTIISGSTTQNSPPNGLWWGLYNDGSGNPYIHWLDGSSANPAEVHAQYTWANYTIAWDASYEYFYINGVLKAQKTKSANLVTNQAPTLSLGLGWNRTNGKFSKLAVYNKCLSQQEITELAKENFKLTTTKAITSQLIESPVIPVDGYYFPLATDTKDVTKVIDASDKTNIVFEDGGAWVGTATTNLFTDPSDFSTVNWNKGGVTTSVPNLVTFTGDYAPLYQPKGAYANGNVYSITWRMAGLVPDQKIRVALEGAVDGGYPQVTLSKYMKTYYRSGTADGTSNFNPLLYQFPGDNGNGGSNISTIRLLHAQLEQKAFPSPFVNGTRGASSLEYNLNSSIGLDWSANWSICYWKKPMGTSDDNFTGYNIDSLGCNGNSVGGSYIWWGKNSGGDSLNDSTPSVFNPTDYFNKWQFVSLVKSGTTLTITTRLSSGGSSVRTATVSLTSNGYVTQHGYDLKLGGWDNAASTNTFFKDLIVAKRAFSDAEVTNIYKQFSIFTDKVNTQNIIEEGI